MNDPLTYEYNNHIITARWCQTQLPLGKRVLYAQDGKGPFYAPKDTHFIDPYGLITKEIAKAKNYTEKTDQSLKIKADYWLILNNDLEGQ
ncbi:unnamed protein product, partial [marine sediment metagenome]